jgi:hypothetical protein
MANRLGWFLGLLVLLVLILFWLIPWNRPVETNPPGKSSSPSAPQR